MRAPQIEREWHGPVTALDGVHANVDALALVQSSDGKWHVVYEFPNWDGPPSPDVWPDLETVPLEWFKAWFKPGWVTETAS